MSIRFHSYKTVQKSLTNNYCFSLASDMIGLSLLMGLSAAFSTVSHSILLQRLDHAIDIKGNATQWFKTNPSYRPTKQTGAGFVLVFCFYFYFYFFLCGQVC